MKWSEKILKKNSSFSLDYSFIKKYIRKKFDCSYEIFKIKENGFKEVFSLICKNSGIQYILKVSFFNREYRVLSLLKTRGIDNVSNIISYEKYKTLHFLILEYIKNEAILNTNCIKKLAGLLAQIHKIQIKSGNKDYHWFVNNIMKEAYLLTHYLEYFPSYFQIQRKLKKTLDLLKQLINSNLLFLRKKRFIFNK